MTASKKIEQGLLLVVSSLMAGMVWVKMQNHPIPAPFSRPEPTTEAMAAPPPKAKMPPPAQATPIQLPPPPPLKVPASESTTAKPVHLAKADPKPIPKPKMERKTEPTPPKAESKPLPPPKAERQKEPPPKAEPKPEPVQKAREKVKEPPLEPIDTLLARLESEKEARRAARRAQAEAAREQARMVVPVARPQPAEDAPPPLSDLAPEQQERGPGIEIGWPESASERERLFRAFRCLGMELAIFNQRSTRFYRLEEPIGDSWGFDPAQYSTYLRFVDTPASPEEARTFHRIAARHGVDGHWVRIFPKVLDQRLLSQLGDARQAQRVRADYRLEGDRLRVQNVRINGRPVAGAFQLTSVPAGCGS